MFEKGKKFFVFLCLLFAAGIFGNNCQIYADENIDVRDFLGYYLCDVQEVGDYENPQIMELLFKQKDILTRRDGLHFGTTGTTVYYDYTDFNVQGTILTCYYRDAYGFYGPLEDIEPGSHKFILTEDGNLLEGKHIWYRYEEVIPKEKEPGTLMAVKDIDFPYGNFTGKACFLGNENIQRRNIEEITFLDSLSEKKENAWDVSVDGDESVWAWTDNKNGKYHVYIAADGGVTANGSCESLFRCCTGLKRIHFNGAFDTGSTGNMDSMFEECQSLENIEGMEQLDTSAAYFMYAMFAGCKKLQYLDLHNFNTSKVTNVNKMFYGCSALKNLDISQLDFSCIGSGDLSDMFIGTRWEGSSPLLDGRTNDITTSYILDTGTMMRKKPFLEAAVISAYDKKIGEASQDGYNLSDTMYALKDLDNDGIPELLLKWCFATNAERHGVYTFSVPICQVRLSNTEIKLDDFSSTHFRYVMPELISYAEADIDADGIEEEIDVAASKDEEGYDYLAVYVDSVMCYDRQIESDASGIKADVEIYSWEESNGLMYLHIHGTIAEEYCGILCYKGNRFTEIASIQDLIDVSQLRNNGSACYFEMQTEYKGNSNIQIMLALEPFVWGDKLKVTVDYRYEDGKLIQVGNQAEVETYERSVFASERMMLSDSVNGKEGSNILAKGDKLFIDKAWLSRGKLWLYMKNEGGTAGWIKMKKVKLTEHQYVPKTKKPEEAQEEAVVWKNKKSITGVKKILKQELKNGKDDLWQKYSDFSYAFSDINRDGQPEMIVKGKSKEENGYLFAVYVYEEVDKNVRKAGDFTSHYEDFYYSPKYSALVVYGRTSSNEVYTFYRLADHKMEEDFMVSWYTDKVTRYYTYEKDGGDKLLNEVPFPETDENLWNSYTGDFRELKFKQTEKAFGNG